MKAPEALKSKTIRAILVAAVLVMMNLLGVGEEEIGRTYDTIHDHRGKQTETAKDLGLLGMLGYAFYGRNVAQGPLKWRKEQDDD